jgi:predicted ATP-dependent Lon-type protease
VQAGRAYYAPKATTSGTSFVASAWASPGPATTDNVPEGQRNLYYRGDRAVTDVYNLLENTLYPYMSYNLGNERRLTASDMAQQTRARDSIRLLGGGEFSLALIVEPSLDYTNFYCLRVPYTEPAATVSVAGGTLDGQASLVLQPGEWRVVGFDGDAPAGTYLTMLSGQVGGSGAGASTVARASEQTLDFVFEAGFVDEVARTMGPRQAGTYASEQRQNVASVTYYLNGSPTPVALPLTLASADVLRVRLTRTDASQAAVLSLFS